MWHRFLKRHFNYELQGLACIRPSETLLRATRLRLPHKWEKHRCRWLPGLPVPLYTPTPILPPHPPELLTSLLGFSKNTKSTTQILGGKNKKQNPRTYEVTGQVFATLFKGVKLDEITTQIIQNIFKASKHWGWAGGLHMLFSLHTTCTSFKNRSHFHLPGPPSEASEFPALHSLKYEREAVRGCLPLCLPLWVTHSLFLLNVGCLFSCWFASFLSAAFLEQCFSKGPYLASTDPLMSTLVTVSAPTITGLGTAKEGGSGKRSLRCLVSCTLSSNLEIQKITFQGSNHDGHVC